MKRISLISAITLLLTVQSAPLLTHAQVVQTNADYHPFYLDAVKYDSTTGVIASNPDYDATDKLVIKNDSISLSSLSYHYIHFWDDAGTYLGHYATSGAKECVNACIGTVSTSDIPLPLGAYSYAIERFDLDDADYDIATNVSLTELFGTTTYNLVGDSDFDYTIVGGRDLLTTYQTNPTIINNTLSNNDFIIDTDLDNLADSWSRFQGVPTLSSGIQRLTVPAIPAYIYRSITGLTSSNYYYVSIKGRGVGSEIRIRVGNNSSTVNNLYLSVTPNSTFTNYSVIITSTTAINITPIFMGSSSLNGDYMEVDYVLFFNLTTLFGAGSEPATATDFETWVTNYTSIDLTTYYSSITGSQLDYPTWVNYYQLWSNNVVSSLEVIDQQYYLNGDRKEIYDLTTIFGSGSEPDLTTMQGYYTDYDALFDYSYISSLAWAVAPTYSVVYWDDQVDDAISGGFMILVSAGVTFVLMLIGFKTRAKLFNLLAMASSVWFTIQAGATLPIILVGFGLIIMNALFFAKEGN